MRTISGHAVSSKEISLSKAAKILSKFVSAENGASHVISAYLHRASASFNELNQLHKELKSSSSHKKHRKHRIETHDDSGRMVENSSVRSVETNQELNQNAYEGDEKSTRTGVKFSQEPNGSNGYHAGNVGGSEKHKKNKKKKHEFESGYDGDSRVKFGEREGEGKLPTRFQNEIESGREQGDEGDGNTGMEEGKKQKKQKKKKDKEGTSIFSSNKGEVENPHGESAMGSKQQKDIEKKLNNSVEAENGGLIGPRDLQSKKKRKYEVGSENNLYAEEIKMEQRKKRKNENLEGRVEDRTEKRMKRKHEGDS